MSLVSFLFSKKFYKHLAIILLLGVVLIFVAIKALNIYTNHGDYIEVPILQGGRVDSLVATASEDYLQYVVVDSVFDDYAMAGTVWQQNPLPGATVKPGRKVYLTIVAKMPEQVKMPNLVDLSLRRAVEVLRLSHLSVSHIHFVSDMALNAVLGQWYQGKPVSADTLLPKYARIELRVGDGYRKQRAVVPFVVGQPLDMAKLSIMQASLNVGRVDTLEDNFEGDLRVYKQSPMSIPSMPRTQALGDTVNLLLRSAKGFDFSQWVGSFLAVDSSAVEDDTLPIDSPNR